MKKIKQEQAEALFRAIGEIDDFLLQEAVSYRPSKRFSLSALIPIAATLLLTTVLLVSTGVMSLWSPSGKNPMSEQNGNAGSTPQTLDSVLLFSRDDALYTTVETADSVPFFSGEAYLVWQYADSEALCISRELSESEVETLTKKMGTGTPVEADSQSPSCRMWLVLGDGRVISPYLYPSSGNVGAATLFDYEAELIPSSEFSSCISDILD